MNIGAAIGAFLAKSWKWIIGLLFFVDYKRTKSKLRRREKEVEDLRILIEIMEEHKAIKEARRAKEKEIMAADTPSAFNRIWGRMRGKDKD
ncbi:MAG: hypothetical protein ABGX83_05300 [Nitrospira sp.]